jgi:hypothetical protein
MPYISNKDPGWMAIQKQLAEALAPFAPYLGARECIHGLWIDCDEEGEEGAVGCPFDKTWPRKGSMPIISEFVLVVNLEDMSQGGSSETISVTSPGLRNTAAKGLLHVALYE